MRFISIPARNLLRRPLRSALTALGIAFAIGGFLALNGLSRGLEQAWTSSLTERGTDLVGVRRGSVDVLAGALNESLGAQLRQVDGIRDVAGQLLDLTPLESGAAVLFRGWSTDSYLWRDLDLLAGELPVQSGPAAAVLGATLASALDKQPGDTVRYFGGRLMVAGIAKPAGVMNNNSLIMPLKTLQSILERPGKVTVFDIRLVNPEDPNAVADVQARLSARFTGLTFTETRLITQKNEILRLWRGMAWGVSIVALVMGLVIVLNTLLISVSERTREIGILSAVGWSRRRILALIVCEGMVLTLSGSAVGILLGWLGLNFLSQQPQLRGFLAVSLPISSLAEYLAATLFLGLFGSLYPAWRAVRQDPVDALRYE